MNEMVEQSSLIVPISFLKMESDATDGLHVDQATADTMADVLLNLRCHLATRDQTCCSHESAFTLIQRMAFIGIGGIAVLGQKNGMTLFAVPADEPGRLQLIQSALIMALALWYCLIADRGWFQKVHKHFDQRHFWMLSCFSLGFFVRPHSTSFLSRKQTDEWKGWMQCVILIYHYTGASKVLPIYQFVRLLVGSYLFMTGFGHTIFFYTKGDFSLRRLASTILRLNLLSCLLPFVMQTNYMFYYFAPLVTFWFLIVYLTMRIYPRASARLVVVKIFVSAVLVTGLVRCPGLLEIGFSHWDVVEWRFRLRLDLYIVFVGMLVAIAHVEWQVSHHRWGIAISLLVLPLYACFAHTWNDKYAFNRWHPYISPLPILAFVILRNATTRLRSFYSPAFAWVGRCSLETFTLQFHVWLAADTKGLLSTGVFGASDFIILTPIFLWLSWHVAAATSVIARAIAG